MNDSSAHPFWSNWFRPGPSVGDEITTLWSNTPLFQGISRREVRKLADSMQPRRYQTDDAVFETGDLGAGAVLILSGVVSIRTGDVVLARLQAGDFFGEVALVSSERRTACAVADEPSSLVFLLQADLEEWIERSPRMGARFALNLATVLADRLRRTNEILSRNGDRG